MIPLSVPCLKGNEMYYITDAVLNGWVSTAGGYVKQLEQRCSQRFRDKGRGCFTKRHSSTASGTDISRCDA